MIRLPQTKIEKSCEIINKHFDIIHQMDEKFGEVDIDDLGRLLDEMDSWKGCIDEITLKLKTYGKEKILTHYEYNNDNNELIIY